ncbi:DUF2235 domain-containing protein [Paracoccus aminophilus]|uniref:T6SS Phospholipase effector Tle1-like catalytic domain-containing protein n=1 Tax=Paracoccus aminophilus JCM 7686 TaxID=1367847 RepID=S5YQT4_PARAH|nr:DUF2235 domain-containing protein [Paracoccus aminophilus]AGT07606.1 hypothetical protein JCM7686_0497 [Paracoccus aminophilus JCM 7686]
MESPRPPLPHVVLIDGTQASLDPAHRSSIGRLYAALSGWWGELPMRLRVRYSPGFQWENWRSLPGLAAGNELESRILAAYTWLAHQWQPGDPLFLFGYSRGAFAVRALAGMIGQVGLLRREALSDDSVRIAWELYSAGGDEAAMTHFRRAHCHPHVPIRMIGVFDTVVGLGVRLPLLWMVGRPGFRFRDLRLGAYAERGAQALALDETRAAFAPLLWDEDEPARIRQMWFRGCHPDIGGQLSGAEYARPLANIPLVWMMEEAEAAGLPLPQGWRDHLPCDATAPSVGSWRSWGKAFLARAPRVAGTTLTEQLHPTVPQPYTGPAILSGALARFGLDKPKPRRPRVKRAASGPSKTPRLGRAKTATGAKAKASGVQAAQTKTAPLDPKDAADR